MEPLNIAALPINALVLVDSAPIIYVLEGHPRFAERFRPLFEAHEAGALQLAITTITVAEVMTGPEQARVKSGQPETRDQELVARYSAVLSSWRVIALDYDIACRAAEFRARYRLKLPDAVQIASALAVDADVLVTHDRDFSRVEIRLSADYELSVAPSFRRYRPPRSQIWSRP